MIEFLPRMKVIWWFLPVALLATANTNAETIAFSYTFDGTVFGFPSQPYASGSTLFGQIDGTIDPLDPNRVTINSFGTVYLSRPGFPLFTFPTIDNNEFNTNPAGGTPVMTFDVSDINFRACPNGFTLPDFVNGLPLSDCPFAFEGGFLVNTVTPLGSMLGLATAADGSGGTICVPPPNNLRGCRVTDRPLVGSWSLVVLPDNASVDPTLIIGSGSMIDQGVVIQENVKLGVNVFVHRNTSIGADTTIGNDTVLSQNVAIGSGVMIGTNNITDQNVVIEDGVEIGNDTVIDQGVYICSGATIGSMVTIGRNRLIDTGEVVPDGIVLNGSETPPGECFVPAGVTYDFTQTFGNIAVSGTLTYSGSVPASITVEDLNTLATWDLSFSTIVPIPEPFPLGPFTLSDSDSSWAAGLLAGTTLQIDVSATELVFDLTTPFMTNAGVALRSDDPANFSQFGFGQVNQPGFVGTQIFIQAVMDPAVEIFSLPFDANLSFPVASP